MAHRISDFEPKAHIGEDHIDAIKAHIDQRFEQIKACFSEEIAALHKKIYDAYKAANTPAAPAPAPTEAAE